MRRATSFNPLRVGRSENNFFSTSIADNFHVSRQGNLFFLPLRSIDQNANINYKFITDISLETFPQRNVPSVRSR